MAKGSDGSGRIYTMVGLIALVAIPLAIMAPGLSRQVAEKDTPRLGPVYDEAAEATEVRPELPDEARPVPAGGNATGFGQASGFGAPTMDAQPTAAVYSDQLPQYKPPEPAKSDGNAGSDPTKPVMRSQSEAERTGAIAAGLSVTPTSKTVSHPSNKAKNAPPRTDEAAPKVR